MVIVTWTPESSAAYSTDCCDVDTAQVWLSDCAASGHITYHREWLKNYRPAETHLFTGTDAAVKVAGIGDVEIVRLIDGVWEPGVIEGVWYIPGFKKNLISVGKLTTRPGVRALYEGNRVTFMKGDNKIVVGEKLDNNTYKLFIKSRPAKLNSRMEVCVTASETNLWHERMAHVHTSRLNEMARRDIVSGLQPVRGQIRDCVGCCLGKAHRISYKTTEDRPRYQVGEFFHSDLCGPIIPTSLGGTRYILTFVDDASSYRTVYFLKEKSQVFEYFKIFEALVFNQFRRRMLGLRTDRGTEYTNRKMSKYMESLGIRHEMSAPATPQENGKAERENRTIVEAFKSMLYGREVPLYLWAEAASTAVHVLNRTICARSPEKTSAELWTGRKPDVGYFRIFGVPAYKYVPKQHRIKTSPNSVRTIFVGYDNGSRIYRLFDPVTRKISTSRDVIFFETECEDWSGLTTQEQDSEFRLSTVKLQEEPNFEPVQLEEEPKNVKSDTESEQELGQVRDGLEDVDEARGNGGGEGSIHDERDEEEQIFHDAEEREDAQNNVIQNCSLENQPSPNRRRTRAPSERRPPARYTDGNYDLRGGILPSEVNTIEEKIPATYEEAISCPSADNWLQAIQAELEAHRRNGTWKIAHRPEGKRKISAKWIFRIKQKSGGGLIYKARLVAGGHLQREGEDFGETFASVSRYETARTLIAWAVNQGLEIQQFDAETAFLHGKVTEEIYMSIPKGVEVAPTQGDAVLLIKSLYGLRQAPRCWFQVFTERLRNLGFRASQADPSLFMSHKYRHVIYIILFVDDGLIFCMSKKLIQKILNEINASFKIKISDPGTFVGMNLVRTDKNELFLHQRPYAESILQRFGMEDCKSVTTPLEPGLSDEGGSLVKVPYRELVGSLMFLSVVSRPDLAFSVAFLSRFLTKYNSVHWEAAKRVLRYIKGTLDYGLIFRKTQDFQLVCYSDADYAGDVETRRSTSGCVFLLAGTSVLWYSRRQDVVALSTTESEYIAG